MSDRIKEIRAKLDAAKDIDEFSVLVDELVAETDRVMESIIKEANKHTKGDPDALE